MALSDYSLPISDVETWLAPDFRVARYRGEITVYAQNNRALFTIPSFDGKVTHADYNAALRRLKKGDRS